MSTCSVCVLQRLQEFPLSPYTPDHSKFLVWVFFLKTEVQHYVEDEGTRV